MGNPSIEIRQADRVAPPIAPPAQPGEVRSCLNCIRLTEYHHGVLPWAECSWMPRFDSPLEGCARWALDSQPRQSILALPAPRAPLAWVGKGNGTKRRRR